jgi:hypothetical protein
MKIILTGATGTIGSHALNAALSSPKVASIIALCRRSLTVQDPKLNVINHKDFSSYPDSLLDQLAGADACLFCMGTFTADRDVNYEYPLSLAKALTGRVKQQGKRMRFVYLSGALGERDLLTRVMAKGDAIRVKVSTLLGSSLAWTLGRLVLMNARVERRRSFLILRSRMRSGRVLLRSRVAFWKGE